MVWKYDKIVEQVFNGDYGATVSTAVCGTADEGSTPSSPPKIKNKKP